MSEETSERMFIVENGELMTANHDVIDLSAESSDLNRIIENSMSDYGEISDWQDGTYMRQGDRLIFSGPSGTSGIS